MVSARKSAADWARLLPGVLLLESRLLKAEPTEVVVVGVNCA